MNKFLESYMSIIINEHKDENINKKDENINKKDENTLTNTTVLIDEQELFNESVGKWFKNVFGKVRCKKRF